MPFCFHRLLALLLGACLPARTSGAGEPTEPTVITGDSFEMRGTDADTVTVFQGHVVVTATGLRLNCDHLEVVSARIGDKDDTVGEQDRFKSLVAVGNVRIVRANGKPRAGGPKSGRART